MKKIFKAILAVSLTGVFAPAVIAQTDAAQKRFCGTEIPGTEWENEFQRLIQERKADKAANKAQSVVYTIPVIIHVLHGGQPVGTYPNLPQAQLNSQILALNNDYAGTGFNSG